MGGRLERPQREIGGDDDADHVGQEAGRDIEEDEEHKEGGAAEDRVGLGNLGLALKVDQSGILGELFLLLENPFQALESVVTDLLVDLGDVVCPRL